VTEQAAIMRDQIARQEGAVRRGAQHPRNLGPLGQAKVDDLYFIVLVDDDV